MCRFVLQHRNIPLGNSCKANIFKHQHLNAQNRTNREDCHWLRLSVGQTAITSLVSVFRWDLVLLTDTFHRSIDSTYSLDCLLCFRGSIWQEDIWSVTTHNSFAGGMVDKIYCTKSKWIESWNQYLLISVIWTHYKLPSIKRSDVLFYAQAFVIIGPSIHSYSVNALANYCG